MDRRLYFLFDDEREIVTDDEINKALNDLTPVNFSACPHCYSTNIYKNGKTKLGKQRYYCKSCSKGFSENTGSPLMYSKKPVELWAKYIRCLKRNVTLRTAASQLNISVSTCFFWRHKVLSVIGKSLNNYKLSNTIQVNELKLTENFKGNRSVKPDFYTARRNYIMILSCFDSSENKLFRTSIISNVGRLDKYALDTFLGPSIHNGKVIIVPRNDKYINFAKYHKMELHMVGGGLDVKMAFTQSRLFKKFMKQFSSVASKYISYYINWYRIKKEYEKLTYEDVFKKFIYGKRQLRIYEFCKVQFDGSLSV